MVKRPVGPPGVPPRPTVGAWLRGAVPGPHVVAAATSNSAVSAAKSALIANLMWLPSSVWESSRNVLIFKGHVRALHQCPTPPRFRARLMARQHLGNLISQVKILLFGCKCQ